MDVSPAVLGGGVNGLTTGLLLALLGHSPTVYAEHRAGESPDAHRPLIASLYPAASVIPHAVTVDDVVSHLTDSHSFFEVLRQGGTCGVRQQIHYELFERPEPAPDYAPALRRFERLPGDGSGLPGAPRRPGAPGLFGWRFQTYFVETPTYLRRLFDLFRRAGGSFVRCTLTPETIEELEAPVLVNCLGASAPTFFPDERPSALLRGCLVHAEPPGPALAPAFGEGVSYNYTPLPSVYPSAGGGAGNLYAYPRTDRWVLGGSKRPGHLDDDGTWRGDGPAAPTTPIDGVDVPTPIVDVNRLLLQRLYGSDIADASMTATYGYRFARDLDGTGVRLDVTDRNGRLVAHNYGHGGAGVTLSWSTALRVARGIRRRGVPMDLSLNDSGIRSAGRSGETSDPSPDPDAALLRMLRMHARASVAEASAA